MQKKIPERRCVGCNESKPKKELIRVVRTPDGGIILDETGKKSGRGVYVCPNETCLTKAIKSKRMDKSLMCEIPDDVYAVLTEAVKRIKLSSEE